MNDFTKKDLIYGFKYIPEIYCEYINVPLTKKEKRKIFLYKSKEMIIEALWFLFFMMAIILQVSSLAYLAGIFFKIGAQ